MSEIDPRALRNAFGSFMTGVTVVTAYDSEKNPIGFTANSFTSVSLNPPLVLVCLANSSQNYDVLVNAAGFAVNVLSENQVEISNTFARPVEDRFASVSWDNGRHSSPVLNDVLAWFECSMYKTVDAGDHVLLMGKVEAFDSTPLPGLGYSRGAYVKLTSATDGLTAETQLVVSAVIEQNGSVLLLDDDAGGYRLPQAKVNAQGASATVKELIATTGLAAEPNFVYSIFEDDSNNSQHMSFLCQAAEGEIKAGQFLSLQHDELTKVSNPAIASMLRRFAAESAVGNFGIYYGNQSSGEVRPIA